MEPVVERHRSSGLCALHGLSGVKKALLAQGLVFLALRPGPARAQDAATVTSTDTVEEASRDPPEKRLALAAGEVLGLGFSVWAVDKWIRGEHWANVTPAHWWQNITQGWEYDGDGFQTNLAGHPYHGALFFNAARSNGFNFWESAVAALAASAAWEYLGETYRPAINDWVFSGITGSNVGEALHRLSAFVTDRPGTGAKRLWLEIAGGLINPPRAFNRLITGELTEAAPGSDELLGHRCQGVLKIGTRTLDADGRPDVAVPLQQLVLELDVDYGDPFYEDGGTPFAFFNLGASLALFRRANVPGYELGRLHSEGSLFSWTTREDPGFKHNFAALLLYDYVNNPAFEFGHTSASARWTGEYELDDDLHIIPSVTASFLLVGATPNDYFQAPDGRTYDMGPGLGLSISATFKYKEAVAVSWLYTSNWIWTASLPDTSRHHVHLAMVEARVPLTTILSFGTAFSLHWRESYYDDQVDVVARNPIAKFFLGISF